MPTPKKPNNVLRAGYPPTQRKQLDEWVKDPKTGEVRMIQIFNTTVFEWRKKRQDLRKRLRKDSGLIDEGVHLKYWELGSGKDTDGALDDIYLAIRRDDETWRRPFDRPQVQVLPNGHNMPSDTQCVALLKAFVKNEMTEMKRHPELQLWNTEDRHHFTTPIAPGYTLARAKNANLHKSPTKRKGKRLEERAICVGAVGEEDEEEWEAVQVADLLDDADQRSQKAVSPDRISQDKFWAAIRDKFPKDGGTLWHGATQISTESAWIGMLEDMREETMKNGKALLKLEYEPRA